MPAARIGSARARPAIALVLAMGLALASTRIIGPAAHLAAAQTADACAAASDPSVLIEVQVGQPAVIALPANVTTGYEWLLAQPPDPGVLQVAGSVYLTPAPANPPMVGQGGIQCWTFVAVGAGTAQAGFNYVRPFDLAAPPANSATFTITVDPQS